MNGHTEKEGWQKSLAELIPEDVDLLHEIATDRIFCSRQAIVELVTRIREDAKEEERKEILKEIDREIGLTGRQEVTELYFALLKQFIRSRTK